MLGIKRVLKYVLRGETTIGTTIYIGRVSAQKSPLILLAGTGLHNQAQCLACSGLRNVGGTAVSLTLSGASGT